MLTWIRILIQNIKFNFLELIWPIQFIGKLKFKYFESNESGRCFEVQIDVKTSSSNIKNSAAAGSGRRRRRFYPSFTRVCWKLLEIQLTKIRRRKEKTRKGGLIWKWISKQIIDRGGISIETGLNDLIACL